jgi:predicted PurR-regulated permease PerM
MADYKDIKRSVVAIIIIGIFVLAFFILKPIIISIIFGLLFAYIFNPVYKAIKSKVKNKSISALILIFGLMVIIIIPIIYFVPTIVGQAFNTYVQLQNFNFAEYFGKFFQGDFSAKLATSVDNIIGQIFSTFLNQFKNLLINFPSFLLQFAVFLFTFYFAIRDSNELKLYLSSLSPFSKETEEKFLKEFRSITNAIIFGQVLIGIIQGLALGLGLLILGIPNVIILTFVTCIVSIIPVLGSWLVWLPVSIFLLLSGQTFAGIFLLLYGALFVGTIDNILRPYILSKQSNLPIILSVIGTIGGLYFFGITGLILGPLVLAYVLIIIEFYQKGKLKDLFSK